MRINSRRLILRDVTMKDAKSIAENANDKLNWYYTESMPFPYSLEDAKKHIKSCMKKQKEKSRKGYDFGIFLKSEKRIVGMISLFKVDRTHKKAGIGYWIGKKYRNQGLVSEAEKVVLDFAFNKLKLNKIKGEAMIENKGSNRLFKKFGFRRIGILREELIKKDKKKDAYAWELLKSNYKTK
jgi:[ribosomal protein S5]-alanine N-acetyltransferase